MLQTVFRAAQASFAGACRAAELFILVGRGEDPGLAAAAGMLGTLKLENPAFAGKVVQLEPGSGGLAPLWEELTAGAEAGVEFYYDRGQRLGRDLGPELPASTGGQSWPLREHGVCLISGGLGVLGQCLAKELLARGVRLVLTGRAPLDAARRERLEALTENGGEAIYVSADVSVAADVERLVGTATEHFGALNGVIHAAGIVEDELFGRKSWDSFARVLAPKIRGTLLLDAATAEQPLDLFVLFSSHASVFWNVGQADYAAANRFLDAFAAGRSRRAQSGQRRGLSLAVQWPLWNVTGGMRPSEAAAQAMAAKTGLRPLPVDAGLAVLDRAMALGVAEVTVLHGVEAAMDEALVAWRSTPSRRGIHRGRAIARSLPGDLRGFAVSYLKDLIVDITQVPPHRFGERDPFTTFGIDSIVITRLNEALERDFGELSKTLFFEHETLAELADHFVEHHGAELLSLQRASAPTSSPAPAASPSAVQTVRRHRSAVDAPPEASAIAIVGAHGPVPGSGESGAILAKPGGRARRDSRGPC